MFMPKFSGWSYHCSETKTLLHLSFLWTLRISSLVPSTIVQIISSFIFNKNISNSYLINQASNRGSGVSFIKSQPERFFQFRFWFCWLAFVFLCFLSLWRYLISLISITSTVTFHCHLKSYSVGFHRYL